MTQVGAGIRFMHKQEPGIVHADLKSPNILLHEHSRQPQA